MVLSGQKSTKAGFLEFGLFICVDQDPKCLTLPDLKKKFFIRFFEPECMGVNCYLVSKIDIKLTF